MYQLMMTFIECLITFLRQGGGIALGYDSIRDVIVISFSSQKTQDVRVLNISLRCFSNSYGHQWLVSQICDYLTHNPRETEKPRKTEEMLKEIRESEERQFFHDIMNKTWGSED